MALGLAALAQRPVGPACVELPEVVAGPQLDLLGPEAAPTPACIRVRLAEAVVGAR